jgi:putative YhbY family RNA-binding protein
MRTLAPAQRRAFRAQAHSLHPVVAIGQHGLTPAVLHEIDVNLLAHELIKIRVFGDDRDEREALLERICSAVDAAPVQHLGKILTIWRPAPPPQPKPAVQRPTFVVRSRAPTRAGKGTAKKAESRRTGVDGSVKRAPRRGRSVIVEATPASSPRRRLDPAAQQTQSRRGRTSPADAASSRTGSANARRRRKA